MFTLQRVFASGALFQADSFLTIKGCTEAESIVDCTLKDCIGNIINFSSVKTDDAGIFSIVFDTPSASFEEYTILLVCGDDSYVMENVLFGEVWLASGQSNMEMPNSAVTYCDKLYDEVADKKIRLYHVTPEIQNEKFPIDPDEMSDGVWVNTYERDKLAEDSAIALKFANDLYDRLNVSANIPVGIIDSSWGGTYITGWFPKSYVDRDEYILRRMKAIGKYPEREKWNTYEFNFQQTFAMYNCKIAPLHGLKFRGVIWYQGENECGAEYNDKIYADYLRFYHKTYSELFAADPARFMIISSQIFPWQYGESGSCCIGYLNNAFVEVASESPDKFAFMPIGDIEPAWVYHQNNHPIHPAKKYEVAERLARLAISNIYGGDGQKSPAYLKSWEIIGNRIRLHFESVGNGIYIGGKDAHCLYVAADDDIYLPAECEIISPDTIDIWCDAIDDPKNAAYGIVCLETGHNIFAGEYPIAPFFTDKKANIRIEAKKWYDSSVTSVWGSKMHNDILDLFYRPLWLPTCGSEVCCDKAFKLDSEASVRIEGEGENFGCYVKSYDYNRLDLQKFGGLTLSLYNTNNLTGEIIFEYEDKSVSVPLTKECELGHGWSRYKAKFGDLPDGDIMKMIFSFRRPDENYRFVNMEKIRLFKK